jgi:hypothetical protein
VIGAILNILASILKLIPGWKDKRVDRIEGEWRNNRDAIDRDLAPLPWWLRDDDPRDRHNGSR